MRQQRQRGGWCFPAMACDPIAKILLNRGQKRGHSTTESQVLQQGRHSVILQCHQSVSDKSVQLQSCQRTQEPSPEPGVMDGEVQAECCDHLQDGAIMSVLSPQGSRQADLIALVQTFEILRGPQAFEHIHVIIQLPYLAQFGDRVPVCDSDVVQSGDAEQHCQSSAFCHVKHRSFLGEHDPQQENASRLDIFSCLFGHILTPFVLRVGNSDHSLNTQPLQGRLPKQLPWWCCSRL
mmetsp:Transcript_16819/g.36177  ORF Transcript_16819/g.36177 Transcript_16819/m.36177 type:complete len:236 (+) Transcript_16819:837-1544(+)